MQNRSRLFSGADESGLAPQHCCFEVPTLWFLQPGFSLCDCGEMGSQRKLTRSKGRKSWHLRSDLPQTLSQMAVTLTHWWSSMQFHAQSRATSLVLEEILCFCTIFENRGTVISITCLVFFLIPWLKSETLYNFWLVLTFSQRNISRYYLLSCALSWKLQTSSDSAALLVTPTVHVHRCSGQQYCRWILILPWWTTSQPISEVQSKCLASTSRIQILRNFWAPDFPCPFT